MRIKWFIIGIIFLILLVAGLLFYLATASPSKPKQGTEVENPTKDLTAEQAALQFNESYVNYLVFAVGGWKLHNAPLSSETPKIKVIADSEIFISEIADGAIITEKKEAENEDIIIRITKQEIVNAILSLDIKEYMKNSVNQGRTELELKAGYTALFSKGYLNIYQELTGKSFTGSVITIFWHG